MFPIIYIGITLNVISTCYLYFIFWKHKIHENYWVPHLSCTKDDNRDFIRDCLIWNLTISSSLYWCLWRKVTIINLKSEDKELGLSEEKLEYADLEHLYLRSSLFAWPQMKTVSSFWSVEQFSKHIKDLFYHQLWPQSFFPYLNIFLSTPKWDLSCMYNYSSNTVQGLGEGGRLGHEINQVFCFLWKKNLLCLCHFIHE